MVSFGLASGTWSDVKDEEAAARGVTLVRGARGTPPELRAFTARRWPRRRPAGCEPVIGQRFPLARAADAHAAIEPGTLGKTLLVHKPPPSATAARAPSNGV